MELPFTRAFDPPSQAEPRAVVRLTLGLECAMKPRAAVSLLGIVVGVLSVGHRWPIESLSAA